MIPEARTGNPGGEETARLGIGRARGFLQFAGHPVAGVLSACLTGAVIALFVMLHGNLTAFSAEFDTGPASPSPYLKLREASLGYHGPSDDFANLSEVLFGWFGPTNLADPLAGDLWWAANFAIQDANSQTATESAVRLPIRLIPRWAVDPWGTGVSQLARMVYEEQPLALLGSVDSASTHLAEQVVAKAQLPLMSPIATDKTVTLAGVSWMFACAPSDAAIARVLVEDVLAAVAPPSGVSNLESEIRPRLALLACSDHESRMTAREVSKELSRRGCRPGFRFDVPPGAADVSRQLAALREARPEVVLLVAGAEDAARLVRALRATWTTDTLPLLFGTHTLGRTRFLELAGPAAEGVRFPLLFVPDAAAPATARFVEQFTEARGRAPDYAAALTFDATSLLVEAVRRAGPNRARIREALHELSPARGIAGPIAFDGTGQNTRTNLGMATIRQGAIVPDLARLTAHRTPP